MSKHLSNIFLLRYKVFLGNDMLNYIIDSKIFKGNIAVEIGIDPECLMGIMCLITQRFKSKYIFSFF